MDMKSGLSRAIRNKRYARAKLVSHGVNGAAQHHYGLAMESYDEYTHCLDDRGLFHPDFTEVVKSSLNTFHRHISIADKLLAA